MGLQEQCPPQGPHHETHALTKPRTKRTTDFPVFVAKKNRPKSAETVSPTEISPTKQLTPKDTTVKNSASTNANANKPTKEGQKKNGFFSGITSLFKKKPLPLPLSAANQKPSGENEVINTEADKFEYCVPSPEATLALSLELESRKTDLHANIALPSPHERVEDIVFDEDRPSPRLHTIDTTEPPLWQIFSAGPSSPSSFECTNLISREKLLPISCAGPTSTHHMMREGGTRIPTAESTVVAESGEAGEMDRSQQPVSSPMSQDGESENTMEVWECYEEKEDDTNSDSNPRERKVTWLFSNNGGGEGSGRGGGEEAREPPSHRAECETECGRDSENPVLPMLFGNATPVPEPKKEYGQYFLKPSVESRTSAMKKAQSSAVVAGSESVTKVMKQVSYCSVEVRFYEYTFGQGIPSDGGPSLGLDWDYHPADTLFSDIESFEEFRGGIIPDDADDDEDWDDNWRIPR
jgi:hypothetical protein